MAIDFTSLSILFVSFAVGADFLRGKKLHTQKNIIFYIEIVKNIRIGIRVDFALLKLSQTKLSNLMHYSIRMHILSQRFQMKITEYDTREDVNRNVKLGVLLLFESQIGVRR